MMEKSEKLSASQEDYLEAIVDLIRARGAARVSDIAEKLAVAKPSVTVALRMLRKHRLVNYQPYELVTLTPQGEMMARKIQRRHEVLSDFFVDVLDMDRSAAEANACRIEHAIGDSAMRRLEAFVDFMKGSDVPSHRLTRAFREHYVSHSEVEEDLKENMNQTENVTMTLADLKPGEQARIERVGGGAAGRSGRLQEMGMSRGALVKMRRVAPLGDPVEIEIRGYNLSLRRNEAKGVAVSMVKNEEK